MMETKVCTKCKVEKPTTGFYKCKLTKAGYQSWCKSCMCADTRMKYLTPEGRERSLAYSRKYYTQKHPVAIRHRYNQPNEVCTILKSHSETLQDDPERLSTEFLQELIGVKCPMERKLERIGKGVMAV